MRVLVYIIMIISYLSLFYNVTILVMKMLRVIYIRPPGETGYFKNTFCLSTLKRVNINHIIFAPSAPKISVLISGMSASKVFLTLASNVLSQVVFPLLEITKTPPTQLFPSFDISGAGGKLSPESNVGCNPGTRWDANAIASLHTLSSCLRHRTMHFESCNFFAPCAIKPAMSCLY